MPQDRLALDRASARTITADGHMRVVGSAVSKSNVCGYLGREIPDYEALGLTADKLYQLYRDPASLEAAASSLNAKPLMIVHRPVTAGDHASELVVGALDNAHWDAPYLRADLTIWDQSAIDLVESGEQRELSCAYRYVPTMQSGTTPEGERYDGVMTQIEMNHCALVADGRAGPDVHVGDSAIEPKEKRTMAKANALSRQALFASGALRAYLRPKLAKDAKLDLAPMLAGVTAKTWDADRKRIKLALDAALPKGSKLLAADSDLADVDELLSELKSAINEVAEPEDDKTAEDEEAETEEEKKARLAKRAADKAAKDAEPDPKDKDKEKDKPAMDTITKPAMDAAITAAVAKAQADTRAATIADMRAIQEAERTVRPFIGELVLAQDSAEAVYKLALDMNGVTTEGVHPSAYAAMVGMLQVPGSGQAARPKFAQDSADAASRFAAQYPTAVKLMRS
jgi:hypothetical protein